LVVSFVLSSCDVSELPPDVGRANPPAPAAVPLVLQGVVLDNSNGSPIGGATVLIQGTSLPPATTNGNGVFTFSDLSNLSAASYVLLATASNYTYGTSVALINKTNNQASSPVILLKKIPVGTTTTITSTGGSGTTSSSEAVPNSANNVKFTIPPGVIPAGQSISVTITALTVDETPPSANPTVMNDISDVLITISPEGTVLISPGIAVTFVLPYSLAPNTVLQVFKVTNNAWETSSSISATVDNTGTSATANIFTAGIYGIFDNDGITTTTGSSVIGGNEQTASSSGSATSITLTNSLVYTPTLPPSSFVYSPTWSGDLLHKILHVSFSSTPGTVNTDITYNLAFPTLPSDYTVNNVESYPQDRNQSGTWYYRWFYIQTQSPTTSTLKNTTTAPFTMSYTSTSNVYVNEDGTLGTTKKTGWYWVAHNQGGLFIGPY
jgi:hypothetical protein